jgi:hypothetical protein
MVFGRDFLEIQMRFAGRAAAITGASLEQTLFIFTSLPVRFGVPFSDLVEAHPRFTTWKAHRRDDPSLGVSHSSIKQNDG